MNSEIVLSRKDVATDDGWLWAPEQIQATREQIEGIHREGVSPQTIKAINADLAYFWEWARLTFKVRSPAYPVPVEVVEAFISNHIRGLDFQIESAMLSRGVKRKTGPHKFTTVSRRVSSLTVAHDVQGFTFESNPCRSFRVLKLIRNARKVAHKNGERPTKRSPITLSILRQILDACPGETLHELRDRALLLFGWSTGGRRRSEIAASQFKHLTIGDNGDYLYFMPESKGDREKRGAVLPLCGVAAVALNDWIDHAKIMAGPIFRSIDRNGNIGVGLTGEAINKIIKRRVKAAGLDPSNYGGHSLRAGFATECGLQGISLENQMMLSTHKSVQTAVQYRRPGDVLNNPAARLADQLVP